MPRHQDNVDVVLTSNPRPSRHFTGSHTLTLENPLEDRSATWWGSAFPNLATRVFQSAQTIGKVFVYAEMTTLDLLHVEPFEHIWGRRVPMSAEPPKVAKFSWQSDKGHDITLSLAAAMENKLLTVVCADPSPPTPVWIFKLLNRAEVVGTYVVDYRETEANPKTPNVESFTVHEMHARGERPTA